MLALSEVKQWLRLEESDTQEDALLQVLIDTAEEYLRNALDSWVDPSLNPLAKLLALTLIADMYENREAVGDARGAAQAAAMRPTIRALVAQLQHAYPTIKTAALPDATVGMDYSATLEADGGAEPYQWDVITGSLPAGLTLDGRTGEVSGTPTEAADTTVTIQLTDSSPTPKIVSRPVRIVVGDA